MRLFANMRRAAQRFAACERGTQLVELSIVLPVMLLLLATTAEFGRFFQTYTTLAKATRSASRFLTIAPANGADDAKAKNLVVYGNTEGTGDPIVSGLTTSQVAITRTGGNPLIPERVTVQIDGFTYQPIFDPGAFIGNDSASLNIDISPKSTMRYFSSMPSS